IKQWRLFEGPTGGVAAQLVRTFDAGGTVEGCVADDENAYLFLSEENVGIWRYGAEPGAGTAHILVDSSAGGGFLTADVEGLTIYYAAGGGGYLLASSQGNSTFSAYQRAAPHAHLLTFQIAANAALGIDAVTGTDGIDVTNRGLGSAFPGGLFVAQDDVNPGGNQNFKLVAWPAIAAAADPPLVVDPSYGAPGGTPGGMNLKGRVSLQRDLLQPDLDASGTISMSISNGVESFVVVGKNLDVLGGTYEVLVETAPESGTFLDVGHLTSTNANAGAWVLDLEASGAIAEFGGADLSALAGRRVEIRSGSTVYLFAVLPALTGLLNVNLLGPLDAAPGSPAPGAIGSVKLGFKAKAGTSRFDLKSKGLPVGPTYTVWVSSGTTESPSFSQVGTLVKGRLRTDTKKGQTLPLGVGFVSDLYGRTVEVRDGTTPVLSGTLPFPAPAGN
ncbi:MAG TPA: phytase, partial [Planctomycetota bacterium]|nr:phytase [Planctomycetota bacterium]